MRDLFRPQLRQGSEHAGVRSPGWVTRIASGAFVALGVSGALLGATARLDTGAAAPRSLSTTFQAPAAAAAGVREFAFTAQEVDWELFPGTRVRAWTYSGQVPGPEIRVTEGDLVRITLKNDLPVPTSVDSVPGLSRGVALPGESFVYEFTATKPGTHWYRPHPDAELQVPLGMYGPVVIEPKTSEPPRYHREYTYVLSEWDLDLSPAMARGEETPPHGRPGAPLAKQLDFDLFLLNGKAHESIPPLKLHQGERVRVRLINGGNLAHTIHPHGHSFRIVATDGNPVPPALQLVKDSVTLLPAERVDLEIEAKNPGVWMLHCHMEQHMANGMMTTVRYEGAQPAAVGGHAGHGVAVPVAAPAPPSSARAAPATLGSATRITMVDNRFRDASVTVKAGTTVEWANDGTNVHTASAMDASFESGSLSAGKTFAYTFDKPGQYQYICRQHLLNGMTGTIVVQ